MKTFSSLLICDLTKVTFCPHFITSPSGWHSDDPQFDQQEFSSPAFQRAYQYLRRSQHPEELDRFEFIEGLLYEGDPALVLKTLLRYGLRQFAV